MMHRSAAARPSFTAHAFTAHARAAHAFKLLAAAALLAAASASPAAAQQRGGAQKPAAQPAAKPAPEAAKPALADAQAAALTYAPWTKICTEADRKRVCLTTTEARLESGLPAAGIVLVEPDKEAKKLRVSLPLGMQIPPGTRLVIDQQRPMTSPYLICVSGGCVAEYDATNDVINRMKRGKQLAVQAVTANGEAIGINLPLADFAQALDGPPTDTSAFEAEQKKRAEDLARRINEARQMVEQARARVVPQGGAPGAPQSAPQAAPQAR
ncbi:MAG: invasion associated locus B family protein [Xanthobacteraceae bacterium]|nr:invasion associated locus B family protein [Xanthobacteraceae bacterium]